MSTPFDQRLCGETVNRLFKKAEQALRVIIAHRNAEPSDDPEEKYRRAHAMYATTVLYESGMHMNLIPPPLFPEDEFHPASFTLSQKEQDYLKLRYAAEKPGNLTEKDKQLALDELANAGRALKAQYHAQKLGDDDITLAIHVLNKIAEHRGWIEVDDLLPDQSAARKR